LKTRETKGENKMQHLRITALVVVVALLAMPAALALAVANEDKGARSLRAKLRGLEEPPAVLTRAHGEFHATISKDESSIEYELSYVDLEGAVTQAHIHVGQRLVNGGISVWLCGTEAIPGPPDTPRCPSSGTVKGTITAANVVGPAGQGVAPGEFEDLLQAIRKGVTYANVHSTLAPGGEIRGQIKVRRDKDEDPKDKP
jgi:CHRD domain